MYQFSAYIFLFILGLIVGSFINVIVLRRSTGKGIHGRSKCTSCSHTLGIFDLIPVLSYIFLRGRCRYCGAKISPMYPLVELVAGLMFVLVGMKPLFLGVSFVYYYTLFLEITFWSIILAIILYDLKHTIIPNAWALVATVVSILFALSIYWGEWKSFLYSILSGIIFGGFFFLIWLLSRGKWMGLGDAKLAFPLGVFVGLGKLFSSWALSFWIGALVMLLYMLIDMFTGIRRKRPAGFDNQTITFKSEVPFGPFLFIGSFMAYLGVIIPINGF